MRCSYNIMPPKDLYCHRCFVQLDVSVQNKLHKCMKKKFILGNCYFNNRKRFDIFWIWPLTQWHGCSAAQDWCVDQVWRIYVKAFLSYWSETKMLQTELPIYIPTDLPTYIPTDRPTDRHVQSNMPSLLRSIHNNKWDDQLSCHLGTGTRTSR